MLILFHRGGRIEVEEIAPEVNLIATLDYERIEMMADSVVEEYRRLSPELQYFDGIYDARQMVGVGEFVRLGEYVLAQVAQGVFIVNEEEMSKELTKQMKEVKAVEAVKRLKDKKCVFKTTSGEIDLCKHLIEGEYEKVDYGLFTKLAVVVVSVAVFLVGGLTVKKGINYTYSAQLQEKQQELSGLKNQLRREKDRFYVLIPRYTIPPEVEEMSMLPLVKTNYFRFERGKLSFSGVVYYYDLPQILRKCREMRLKCRVRHASARGDRYEVVINR